MAYRAVSIVIPVFNDPLGLQTTLDSILSHTPYPDYEILIVDNNSTDETPTVGRKYAEDQENISIVFERNIQSSYAARNTGVEHAEGEVIVFLDADQRATSGWLTAAINRMVETDAAYLAPDIELDPGEHPGIIARYNETSGFPIEDFLKRHRYAPTSCLFVRRDLIEAIGPFDERLVSGGDLEFGNRVADAGYELVFAPSVRIIHPTRRTLRALIKRNLRIGRGHCQLQRYHPERYGTPGIPPRPSGIREDQYDGSIHPALYRAITAFMTVIRGVGYYSEFIRYTFHRLFR